MNSNQIRKGVVQARRVGTFDGWFVVAEALLFGIIAFAWANNAVVGLAVFVLGFALLSRRVVGTIASIVFGGLAAWWAGQNAFLEFGRWDAGVAVGLIIGFITFSFHIGHVKAFEKY